MIESLPIKKEERKEEETKIRRKLTALDLNPDHEAIRGTAIFTS